MFNQKVCFKMLLFCTKWLSYLWCFGVCWQKKTLALKNSLFYQLVLFQLGFLNSFLTDLYRPH